MARGRRRASLAVAILAVAGSLPACQRRPELAPVGLVQVRAADLGPALAAAGLDGATMLEAARGALAVGGFRLDERARRSYQVAVEVVAFGVAPESGGGPIAEVVVDVQFVQSWAAGPLTRRAGNGRAPLTAAGRPAALREAFRGAIGDAAASVALDLRAQQRPTSALVADLGGGDPRARERAVRALASRGANGSVRSVEKLVRDPDPFVARAAVDALVAFKDPASARALIEAAQAGDVATTLRLLPVLVEIGGADVEGYLLTLESGHGDRGVRRAASEALARFRTPRRAAGDARR